MYDEKHVKEICVTMSAGYHDARQQGKNPQESLVAAFQARNREIGKVLPLAQLREKAKIGRLFSAIALQVIEEMGWPDSEGKIDFTPLAVVINKVVDENGIEIDEQ